MIKTDAALPDARVPLRLGLVQHGQIVKTRALVDGCPWVTGYVDGSGVIVPDTLTPHTLRCWKHWCVYVDTGRLRLLMNEYNKLVRATFATVTPMIRWIHTDVHGVRTCSYKPSGVCVEDEDVARVRATLDALDIQVADIRAV